MTAHVIHDTATGEARSIGTIVASSLPAGLTDLVIPDTDFDALVDGTKVWQPSTRTIVVNAARIVEQQAKANYDAIVPLLAGALTRLTAIQTAAPVAFTTIPQAQTAMRGIQSAVQDEALILRRLVRMVANVLDGTG